MKKILIIVTIITITLMGCSQESSINISGSTSATEYAHEIGIEYRALTGIDVEYQAIGSSSGIKNANDGVTTFGISSRALKDDEIALNMTVEPIAFNAIVMVVSKNNDALSSLTVEQIQQIYKGEITNWSEIGGPDAKIVVVSRESGSGTRSSFEDAIDIEESDVTQSALISEGNGNVASTVASNQNAIGYISLDAYAKNVEQLKSLKVNNVEANIETVQNGEYPIALQFLIMYHEENLSEIDQKFIEWLLKEGVYELAPKAGLIPPK